MFGINAFEMVAIAVLALLIFGPEKLPDLAKDAARLLREVRKMATGAKADLKDSIGPELGDLNISDLDPRTFVRRNLFDPIEDEVTDVKRAVDGKDDESGDGERKPPRPKFDSDTT